MAYNVFSVSSSASADSIRADPCADSIRKDRSAALNHLKVGADGRWYCTFADCDNVKGWPESGKATAINHVDDIHIHDFGSHTWCEWCDYHSRNEEAVKNHYKAHFKHTTTGKKSIVCDDCALISFRSPSEMISCGHGQYCLGRNVELFPENRLPGRVWDTETRPISVASITHEAKQRLAEMPEDGPERVANARPISAKYRFYRPSNTNTRKNAPLPELVGWTEHYPNGRVASGPDKKRKDRSRSPALTVRKRQLYSDIPAQTDPTGP